MIAVAALVGALQSPLDSQVVLDRYNAALANLTPPKAVIFSYSVSQAGPTDLEQRHRVYRSGIDVRDEIVEVNGLPLKRRIVRVRRRSDPYAISALAPRAEEYELLFVRAQPDGARFDYIYRTFPLRASAAGFVIDRVVIDGRSYLPRTIDFHTSNGAGSSGTGTVTFSRFGGYWMPTLATVSAVVAGTVARERIVFGDYDFPPALPRSTFL
jgi:hypothetical protein